MYDCKTMEGWVRRLHSARSWLNGHGLFWTLPPNLVSASDARLPPRSRLGCSGVIRGWMTRDGCKRGWLDDKGWMQAWRDAFIPGSGGGWEGLLSQNQILRGNVSLFDSDKLRFLLIFDFWDPWARGG